jgi:hypothetical protein
MQNGHDTRSVADLTRASDLVFRGRVLELGSSAVRAVRASAQVAVVELSEALRADPVLGDLTGKPITVELLHPDELQVGEEAIFFTRDWVHGENVAVHEIAHVPVSGDAGAEVTSAVHGLPDLHLQSRLDSADLVVVAAVTSVTAVEGQSGRRQSPRWARARLTVSSVLKGRAGRQVDVYFPTGDDKTWRDCPRLTRRQRAVFLLHRGDPMAGEWLESPGLPEDALTALDPSDVLAAHEQERVAAMSSA